MNKILIFIPEWNREEIDVENFIRYDGEDYYVTVSFGEITMLFRDPYDVQSFIETMTDNLLEEGVVGDEAVS